MKKEFIQSEIWMLTFNAAFQRANVYKGSGNEKAREDFKKAIKIFVENIVSSQYTSGSVSDEIHLLNIENICEESKKFSGILENGCLRFGVAQKIFNLFLKYQWCIGAIATPPHFPVDRIIQTKLEYKPIVSWTQLESSSIYMLIINHAREHVKTNSKYESIADCELKLFRRENSF